MAESCTEYWPVLADVPGLLERHRPLRVLVIGGRVPEQVVLATEARHLATAEPSVPTGNYVIVDGDRIEMLHVVHGNLPEEPMTATADTEAEWLIRIAGWFPHWWADATVIESPKFEADEHVVLVPSGQEGLVRSREFAAGGWSYRVRVAGATQRILESGMGHVTLEDDPLEWIQAPSASARRFAATLTRAKVRERLTDTIYSFRASRTIFRPYQFQPVIRLLETGQLRLLIADEVGLGKTIEAGLIWTELDARNMANRVLVVCPSGLVAKWRSEMQERFGFELVDWKREQLDEMLERLREDRLPQRFHAICSLERLRIWPGLEELAEIGPHFDLVIADEAHAFRNSETASYAVGSFLNDWSDAVVFLSATPLNLGNDDLFNLLQLLAPGDFSDKRQLGDLLEPNAVLNRIATSLLDITPSIDRLAELERVPAMTFGRALAMRPEFAELRSILAQVHLLPAEIVAARHLLARLHTLSAVVTRTRKAEIQEEKAVREAHTIDVEWTEEERAFYEAFERWQISRAQQLRLPVGFVTQMPLRLASSCLPMARARVLDGDQRAFVDDLDADDDTLGGAPDPNVPPTDVVQLAKGVGEQDSKFDRFVPFLKMIVGQGRQVIVFTFSRATLAYLDRRLGDDFGVAVLHGDVKGEDRQTVMRQFREGKYQVLLASRVASEGLDFEFCSAVVNYDLPWNPMEVEQRIGRIDRFGQREEKVLIVNFSTPGTIETDIVARLMTRIGVFKDSIGDLEPIVQSAMTELNSTFDFTLSRAEQVEQVRRVLAAIEDREKSKEELETAAAYLSSTDQAEIEGLEQQLVASGRYVGQRELVLLIEDWIGQCSGASCSVNDSETLLAIRGNREMEAHLRSVRGRGERSEVEIDRLAFKLRDEQEILVHLDQEAARTQGGDLLTAAHPLVRAALGIPGNRQARFSSLTIADCDAPHGTYLVLIAVARWQGIRPATELWAEAVETGSLVAEPAVGLGVLARLAEAELRDGNRAPELPILEAALQVATSNLLGRQAREEGRRLAENAALVDTRRVSLEQTYQRKVERIRGVITTLRSSGKTKTIPLQEAQLRKQGQSFEEAQASLQQLAEGSLRLEELAVCLVTVE